MRLGISETEFVRRLLAAIVARSSRIRTFFVVTPLFLLGGALAAYGLIMASLCVYMASSSLYRLYSFIAFSPYMLAGGLLICLGFATIVALRRADRTVGGFFEERVRDGS